MQLKAPGFLAGISLCVALFAGFGYGADVKLPAVAGIRRIDIGPVDSISSIRSAAQWRSGDPGRSCKGA